MKSIALLGAAMIAGAIRYPIEGPFVLHDEEAERLIKNGQAELLEPEDELDDLTVKELKVLAEEEKTDLGPAERKADIIAAIRKARASETED